MNQRLLTGLLSMGLAYGGNYQHRPTIDPPRWGVDAANALDVFRKNRIRKGF